MKSKKTISIVLVLAGLLLFFVSIYGFQLGIAKRESFGAFQWLGTITGTVIFVYSLIKLFRKP